MVARTRKLKGQASASCRGLSHALAGPRFGLPASGGLPARSSALEPRNFELESGIEFQAAWAHASWLDPPVGTKPFRELPVCNPNSTKANRVQML